MNKEQLLAKADELIAQSNILNAKANELKELANKEESNVILVPDNIQITESVCELGKWIVNWTQQLYYDTEDNHWIIDWHKQSDKIKCKLTPCKYEDLQPWDIFYRDDNANPDFDDLIWYAIKLKEWYQFWDCKDCNYWDIIYNNNWKVEEL